MRRLLRACILCVPTTSDPSFSLAVILDLPLPPSSQDVSEPHWLDTEPEFFYGWWGMCYNNVRSNRPPLSCAAPLKPHPPPARGFPSLPPAILRRGHARMDDLPVRTLTVAIRPAVSRHCPPRRLRHRAVVARRQAGTSLSGSISTVLTGLSLICVGIHSRRALPSPVCA